MTLKNNHLIVETEERNVSIFTEEIPSISISPDISSFIKLKSKYSWQRAKN